MKRPWNLPDLPVYSIASIGDAGLNMNICTYVTAISMSPKKYIVGVYEGTKTLENIRRHPKVILQLLGAEQYRLVRLLGQKSGNSVNKLQKLADNISTSVHHETRQLYFLKDAVSIMYGTATDCIDAGDHFAYLIEIDSFKNLHESPLLTTCILREKGIIRA